MSQQALERRMGFATNEMIRRAHPTVDSPLGEKILGKITEEQYQQRMAEKRARELPVRP